MGLAASGSKEQRWTHRSLTRSRCTHEIPSLHVQKRIGIFWFTAVGEETEQSPPGGWPNWTEAGWIIHGTQTLLRAPATVSLHRLLWGTCSEKNEILQISAYMLKKKIKISLLLSQQDSFRSHWCWERLSLPEVEGDYKSSGCQLRCSVPRRLICWLISPKHVLGEPWGQQNTICRARSLIRSRSGTRLVPATPGTGRLVPETFCN